MNEYENNRNRSDTICSIYENLPTLLLNQSGQDSNDKQNADCGLWSIVTMRLVPLLLTEQYMREVIYKGLNSVAKPFIDALHVPHAMLT